MRADKYLLWNHLILHNLLIFRKKKNEIQNHLFFTKKDLPISKFKKIHATEVRHGMQLGEAYVNDTSTGAMINFIGDSIAFILKNTLENCIFSAF